MSISLALFLPLLAQNVAEQEPLTESVPLLADIPLLSASFERWQDPQDSVPFLSDVPLIGTMFVDQGAGVVPDPELQWDGATEDIYRRAMHQMTVRANYAEAARLLLSIADSDPVIQVPGQASWVLGQAALALAMDGRSEEASAMVTGIHNGSVGTELEPQVAVLLERLERMQDGAQELDRTFLDFLWNRLRKFPESDQDRGTDIRAYGRQALPYLEHIVRTSVDPQANAESVDFGMKAMRFALSMGDQAFADRMLLLLRARTRR